jgi:hypothetical protein
MRILVGGTCAAGCSLATGGKKKTFSRGDAEPRRKKESNRPRVKFPVRRGPHKGREFTLTQKRERAEKKGKRETHGRLLQRFPELPSTQVLSIYSLLFSPRTAFPLGIVDTSKQQTCEWIRPTVAPKTATRAITEVGSLLLSPRLRVSAWNSSLHF